MTQVTLIIWDRETNTQDESFQSITRTLSDSIVTMFALPSLQSDYTPQVFIMCVFNVLFCLRFIWQQSLREGFTIRGGIEIGEMFWNEVEFTGPGLIYAHKLENKYAINSRVLVGPNLATQIINFFNPLVESPIKAFAISEDGKIIVDPHFTIGQEMVNSLVELQQSAGQFRSKYDEVINILKTPKDKVRRPTLAEMSSYTTDIMAKFYKDEP